MNHPDTSMSFGDLILRVAVEVGLSDTSGGVDAIPSDPGDLAKVKRAVNDGIGLFARAWAKWRWMEPEVTLTMDPDGEAPECVPGTSNEYVLPWFCQGSPLTDWITTVDPNGIGTRVQSTSIERIRAYRSEDSDYQGRPGMAAHVVHQPGNGQSLNRPRWKVVFDRNPDSAYVLTARFRVAQPSLVELTDRHLAGSQHDQSVVDAAVWAYWRGNHEADAGVRGSAQERFNRAVAESVSLDSRQRESNLGPMLDPSICDDAAPIEWNHAPLYVNGVDTSL